jgi:hypothetical protein
MRAPPLASCAARPDFWVGVGGVCALAGAGVQTGRGWSGRFSGRPGGPPLPWTVTTLGLLGTRGTPMVTKYQKFGDGYKAEAVKLSG